MSVELSMTRSIDLKCPSLANRALRQNSYELLVPITSSNNVQIPHAKHG